MLGRSAAISGLPANGRYSLQGDRNILAEAGPLIGDFCAYHNTIVDSHVPGPCRFENLTAPKI